MWFRGVRTLARSTLPEPMWEQLRRRRRDALMHPTIAAIRAARWEAAERNRLSGTQVRTLNDKIRYRMAFDRRPILTQMADKFAVREMVRQRVGESPIPRVHSHHQDESSLRNLLSSVPDRCVMKASHACGATIIVDDRAPSGARIPPLDRSQSWPSLFVRIRREDIDTETVLQYFNRWLSTNYWSRGIVEWAYRGAVPRIIVEELLDDNGALPRDFKFWCFDGEIGFIQVDIDRGGDHRRQLLTPDWVPLEAAIKHPPPDSPPASPDNLDELIRTAEALADGIDFVRVDLYSIAGEVRFGELTNYPGGGTERMTNGGLLAELGHRWNPASALR